MVAPWYGFVTRLVWKETDEREKRSRSTRRSIYHLAGRKAAVIIIDHLGAWSIGMIDARGLPFLSEA